MGSSPQVKGGALYWHSIHRFLCLLSLSLSCAHSTAQHSSAFSPSNRPVFLHSSYSTRTPSYTMLRVLVYVVCAVLCCSVHWLWSGWGPHPLSNDHDLQSRDCDSHLLLSALSVADLHISAGHIHSYTPYQTYSAITGLIGALAWHQSDRTIQRGTSIGQQGRGVT